jgi:hypothetical protein
MNPLSRWLPACAVSAAACFSLPAVWAACPCQSQGVAAMPAGQFEAVGDYPSAPEFDALPAPLPLATMTLPPGMSSAPIGTATPGTNRFGMTPPPGTLGQTYQRRTTLLPDEKHPRLAIVNVHVAENVDVTARGLKSKWNGKYWELESEAPLLPGVPHIYAIKTEKKLPSGEKQVDVRWVRLIMGRVVDLEF